MKTLSRIRKNSIIMLLAAALLSGCASEDAANTTQSNTQTTDTVAEISSVESTIAQTTEMVTEAETTEEETEIFVKNENRKWINQADISWIDPEKPMVAISFDDGPVNPVSIDSTAIRIQNALAENGMHATFFYLGNTLNKYTIKELEMAYEKGFELGNHTSKHNDLTKLSKEEIEEQVYMIDEVLFGITGLNQFLLRPPYLSVNQLVKDTINVPLISCGLDTKDWNKATTEEIIATIKKAVENGSLDGQIVLMHETLRTTAEAIEYLIPYLKEQGYQVVTISELFKVRGVEMQAGKIYTTCK